MIKNSFRINHQKGIIEIKLLVSRVEKTSEYKLVAFSAKMLTHKILYATLWNLALNRSGNLDFFICLKE